MTTPWPTPAGPVPPHGPAPAARPAAVGTPPGWYPDPDPSAPGSLRWFDGTGWTAHRAPTPFPPVGTAPGGAGGGAGKVVLVIAVVVGALLVVSILAAIAIPVFLNQSAKAEAAVVAAMTCDDVVAGTLAPGAVNLVDTGLPAPDAIGDVTLDSDYRPVPELPPPGQYSLVLVCSGTGVWADGSERALMAAGRVDSGGRVSFEWAAMP